MVAISGSGWRLAPALIRLVNETDELFPNRSTISDGSIGDTAHSARTSDHNPDGGWVDAVDLTDDDAHGCDVALLAHHLVAKRDPRVSYLIHKGTIWRGYDKPGLPAFTPQPYTGPNAHEKHLHVSIADAHRADAGPWWPQSEEDADDMTPDQAKQLASTALRVESVEQRTGRIEAKANAIDLRSVAIEQRLARIEAALAKLA